MEELKMTVIGHIHTDFNTKFGIPRQSGLVENEGYIVFEKEYRSEHAVRGLEGFSHIWVLWYFTEASGKVFSPTVRPPRLGGNTRVGVFASRSPFRPNSIGLSALKLTGIELEKTDSPILHVSGADMLDNTPILDIKPYLPYADCILGSTGGFSDSARQRKLNVVILPGIRSDIPEKKLSVLKGILALDPRPSYQESDSRVYSFEFAGYNVRFTVEEDMLIVSDILGV